MKSTFLIAILMIITLSSFGSVYNGIICVLSF